MSNKKEIITAFASAFMVCGSIFTILFFGIYISQKNNGVKYDLTDFELMILNDDCFIDQCLPLCAEANGAYELTTSHANYNQDSVDLCVLPPDCGGGPFVIQCTIKGCPDCPDKTTTLTLNSTSEICQGPIESSGDDTESCEDLEITLLNCTGVVSWAYEPSGSLTESNVGVGSTFPINSSSESPGAIGEYIVTFFLDGGCTLTQNVPYEKCHYEDVEILNHAVENVECTTVSGSCEAICGTDCAVEIKLDLDWAVACSPNNLHWFTLSTTTGIETCQLLSTGSTNRCFRIFSARFRFCDPDLTQGGDFDFVLTISETANGSAIETYSIGNITIPECCEPEPECNIQMDISDLLNNNDFVLLSAIRSTECGVSNIDCIWGCPTSGGVACGAGEDAVLQNTGCSNSDIPTGNNIVSILETMSEFTTCANAFCGGSTVSMSYDFSGTFTFTGEQGCIENLAIQFRYGNYDASCNPISNTLINRFENCCN